MQIDFDEEGVRLPQYWHQACEYAYSKIKEGKTPQELINILDKTCMTSEFGPLLCIPTAELPYLREYLKRGVNRDEDIWSRENILCKPDNKTSPEIWCPFI